MVLSVMKKSSHLTKRILVLITLCGNDHICLGTIQVFSLDRSVKKIAILRFGSYNFNTSVYVDDRYVYVSVIDGGKYLVRMWQTDTLTEAQSLKYEHFLSL
jgi:hypothetical protein